MNLERDEPAIGGRSLIALLIPTAQGNVNEEHTNFALQQFQLFREEVPDLRFIFWAGGSAGNAARFERFVVEPERDLHPLTINLRGIGTDSISGKLRARTKKKLWKIHVQLNTFYSMFFKLLHCR